MTSLAERAQPFPAGSGRRSTIPDGLPSLGPREPVSTRRSAAQLAVVTSLPVLVLLGGLLVGGGPRTEGADDALLTLAMRDTVHHAVLVGPYSRFGWHHPGPTYLYLAGITTRLWGGGPTGSWVGATLIAVVAGAVLVLAVDRAAGRRAGWWAAATVLFVEAGLGVEIFRDPWNPYVVVVPVLLAAVLSALAGAGRRGMLAWAAVVGSFAIQTHLSCAPAVGVVFVAALVARSVAWRRERRHPQADDIPTGLPGLTGPPDPVPAWRRRPDLVVASAILVFEWLPPLWDEAFGTHNLTAIWNFFTASNPSHSWDMAWRQVVALIGLVLFQHHAAFRDGVADPHVVLTTIVFVGLCAVAVMAGLRRRRPVAVWLGGAAVVGAAVSMYSVTRVVGYPYRYLMFWVTAMPALAVIGVVIGLQGVRPRLAATEGVRLAGLVTGALTVVAIIAALHSALSAEPAVDISDRDVAASWKLLQPIVGEGHTSVFIEIADNSRWPTAAGLALELERHGHPARVADQWTLLFGDNRRATGLETDTIYVAATATPARWPGPSIATPLGQAGKSWLFLAKRGALCWRGWIPFGGPACPVGTGQPPPAAPVGGQSTQAGAPVGGQIPPSVASVGGQTPPSVAPAAA